MFVPPPFPSEEAQYGTLAPSRGSPGPNQGQQEAEAVQYPRRQVWWQLSQLHTFQGQQWSCKVVEFMLRDNGMLSSKGQHPSLIINIVSASDFQVQLCGHP